METCTPATESEPLTTDPSVPVYAEYRGPADWQLHLPRSPHGPLTYCLTRHGEHPFAPDLATAELAAEGWAVVDGADGWSTLPPGSEHQWTARVLPAAPDPAALEDATVAVPAGLMEALRAVLEEELEAAGVTGVDVGTVALEQARAAVRYQHGHYPVAYRPGAVL